MRYILNVLRKTRKGIIFILEIIHKHKLIELFTFFLAVWTINYTFTQNKIQDNNNRTQATYNLRSLSNMDSLNKITNELVNRFKQANQSYVLLQDFDITPIFTSELNMNDFSQEISFINIGNSDAINISITTIFYSREYLEKYYSFQLAMSPIARFGSVISYSLKHEQGLYFPKNIKNIVAKVIIKWTDARTEEDLSNTDYFHFKFLNNGMIEKGYLKKSQIERAEKKLESFNDRKSELNN